MPPPITAILFRISRIKTRSHECERCAHECARHRQLPAPLWYVHPRALSAAIHFGFENRELPQTIHKLRVLRRGGGIFNRTVEPPEHLLEGVVVAFAVAAG